MSYFHFNNAMYEFLCRAAECFLRQPNRQFYFEKQKDEDHILYLLLKDDPCQTMARPNREVLFTLYDGSCLAGYLDKDILDRLISSVKRVGETK